VFIVVSVTVFYHSRNEEYINYPSDKEDASSKQVNKATHSTPKVESVNSKDTQKEPQQICCAYVFHNARRFSFRSAFLARGFKQTVTELNRTENEPNLKS